MEKKRTKATDIMEIAAALDGKVDFQQISFNQVLTTDHGKSVNDLLFVAKKWGIYFYTSRSSYDCICTMDAKQMPTYVVCEGSNNVYEIKNTFRV